jgi:hypothetical protein
MRRLVAPAALFVAAASTALAAPPIGEAPDSATVSSTPPAAGARPSAVLLKLHYDMVCAQPGRGPVTISFPPAFRVPAHVARSAVLVDGDAAPSVSIHGTVATVGLPPVAGQICQSLVPGTLRVQFTRSARIGNPVHAGRYSVHAAVGTHTFVARLRIRS